MFFETLHLSTSPWLAPLFAKTFYTEGLDHNTQAFFTAQFYGFTDNGLFVQEPWGESYHQSLYMAPLFGNLDEADCHRFRSRGFGRVIGRAFYTQFSRWSGIDCVSNPDRLLDPTLSYISWLWTWLQRKGVVCAVIATSDFDAADLKFNGHSLDCDMRAKHYYSLLSDKHHEYNHVPRSNFSTSTQRLK